MSRNRTVKTARQVLAHFNYTGKSVSQWARDHGYRRSLVYEVLRGRVQGSRGKSHEIAVLLGMKDGEIVS